MERAIPRAVARNVRSHREASGLSVGALAAASGVGKATLSRIESRQANPTLETLFALADALGVSLGALVADEGGVDRPAIGGVVEARLIERIDPGRLVEVLDIVFPAGRVRRSGAHPAGVVEHLVVTRGRLRAGPAGHEVDLEAGDLLRFGADVPHTYAATGAEPAGAVVLMVYPG